MKSKITYVFRQYSKTTSVFICTKQTKQCSIANIISAKIRRNCLIRTQYRSQILYKEQKTAVHRQLAVRSFWCASLDTDYVNKACNSGYCFVRRLCAIIGTYILTYTECPRRNVPYFGRVFLMLKYTDITQNVYILSWTVTELMAREKCGLLSVPRTAPFQLTRYVYSAHVVETGMQSTLCLRAHVKCVEP